ncbi:MAG TPA: F0F1 ATP synthase subunit epsilon [Candidatus Solibacter sp.]
MAETLELEVATPERELVREQVSEVQVPAAQGYLGVLPGHAPLLGMLGIGTLSYVVGGNKRHISVHGGFLEILEDHVRVLADVAERAEEIDIQRAKAALERSQREALNPALGVDPAEALAATMRAEARLATAEKK